MTNKESICVRCGNLSASENGYCKGRDGRRSLISECYYGGKNAGNRKSCKKFMQAKSKNIEARLKLLDGGMG